MKIFEAIILAIIEGITEFLPVSSTGHMIIASSLMGIAEDPFTKLFTVAIQFGAILSVVVLYFKRFFKSLDFYFKLFVAFIPAAILGWLLDDVIDELLGNVLVVGFTLLAGGVLLVFIDQLLVEKENANKEEVTYLRAFKIGLFQCIAMVPGVSRSAATIIGGLTQKLSRRTAAEFSFFLAVPTMFAATVYKMYKYYKTLSATGASFSHDQIMLLLIGNVLAFIVAMLAIKSFITFLTKHGFRVFGYYRIAMGVVIIILVILGVDLKIS